MILCFHIHYIGIHMLVCPTISDVVFNYWDHLMTTDHSIVNISLQVVSILCAIL